MKAGSDRIEPAVPLIASLLGVPYEDRYGPLDLSPQVQRSRTLEALVEQLLGLARHKPVLVVMEDVHWIDPSTLEFVQLMLDPIEGRRVLMLLTSRPDGQPVLAGHPHVTRLVLNRLGRAAVEAMTDAIEGSAALPDAVRREIVARTDGVPLFVEELTRALVELAEQSDKDSSSDVEPHASGLNVPATLHDSLMSRLDRLPEVKRVAQIAACIGRQFHHRTLAGVAGVDERELQSALDRLVGAELRLSPRHAARRLLHLQARSGARCCGQQPAAQRVPPGQCQHHRAPGSSRAAATARADCPPRRTGWPRPQGGRLPAARRRRRRSRATPTARRSTTSIAPCA